MCTAATMNSTHIPVPHPLHVLVEQPSNFHWISREDEELLLPSKMVGLDYIG